MKAEATSPRPSAPTWVDRLRMVPLADDAPTPAASTGDNAADRPLEFNIASLNVLAESYLTSRSHPGLPERYARVAFDPTKRRKLLLDTLQRFCGPRKNGSDEDAKETKWDILALQELDMLQPDDPVLPAFDSWGYGIIRTPGEQRRDCCAIAYDRSKFALVHSEMVLFDDLATLQDANDGTNQSDSNVNEGYSRIRPKKPNSPSELTGMVRSFLRRNGAVVAHLQSKETGHSLVVASVHLYWHPGYEYVKLCQAKYLLDKVAAFASSERAKIANAAATSTSESDRIPTIICGDTNSKPGSIVYKLFVQPNVDARTVAPWRYVWDRDSEEMYTEDDENDRKDGQDEIIASNEVEPEKKKEDGGYMMSGLSAEFTMYCGMASSADETNNATGNKKESTGLDSAKKMAMALNKKWKKGLPGSDNDTEKDIDSKSDDLDETLESRRINGFVTPQDYEHDTPPIPVKYLLDYTLNRFTRWLRILGIDATLETAEEEKERTGGGNIAIFDHCKTEQRTLLTTSYKLLLRKDCPPGAYLLDPKSSADLERALPRLLRTHGVELSPCTFLTRCVVCNGSIDPVVTDEEKATVFVEHGAPGLVNSEENIEVFRCDKCQQGYWWDDRPSSSASRVFTQATKLLRLCLRGGVGLKDEAIADEKKRNVVMGAFDFVDVAKERQSEGSTESDKELSVIKWLREERMSNPLHLRSAYAAEGVARESLPFTNVTKEFVGCLDYVFYEPTHFVHIARLKVPTSFRDMNASGTAQGHLIPSDIWPSDHLAVGARLRLKQESQNNSNVPKVSSGNATGTNGGKTTGALATPASHSPKCGCGCVPQILSLFEMAELRKKLREKKAAEAAAKLSG